MGKASPAPLGQALDRPTIRGHAKRGTGLINNELYIGRLIWNRLHYVRNPETGKRVSRINPPEDWIVAEVPELRIVDNDLWQAVKDRQGEITEQYATVIEDGRYVRGMVDRLSELEARQDELTEQLTAVPADFPDIHPNIAYIYRRKVARLAGALDHPEDRDAAASPIRGLIERIVLTPGEKWAAMDAVLHGDLGTILEWAGNGRGSTKTDISMPEMSVSVVAREDLKLRPSGYEDPTAALSPQIRSESALIIKASMQSAMR